jgi:hypothetical protein
MTQPAAEIKDRPLDELPDEEKLKYLGEFSDRVNNMEVQPVKTIYIQLEAVQALDLGALFLMIKTQTEYDYILSKLDDYGNCLTDDTASVFPALGFTNKQIKDYMVEHPHEVCVAGPMRKVFAKMPELGILAEYGRVAADDHRNMTVYVSCRHFELPEVVKFKWLMLCKDLFEGDIDVKFFHGGIAQCPVGFFDKQDFMIVEDFPEFVKHPDIVKGMKNDKLWPRRLWALRRVDPTIVDPKRENIDECLEYTEMTMGSYIRFYPFTQEIIRGDTNE